VAPGLALALCCAALAQELPPAEISSAFAGSPTEPESNARPVPESLQQDYLEIYSKGYSRFEIGDDGHILVVYTGGVQFSYRGYRLSADELRFDQATSSASISGDVHFSSDQFTLSTQKIELDGLAGRGSISGHIVGSMSRGGVSFEADSATLTFPPGPDLPKSEEAQLVLSGGVRVSTSKGFVLRTDQVAFDGATRRFSSAPFTLVGSLRSGKAGVEQLQLTGTALNGAIDKNGQVTEVSLIDLLAVSQVGRLSAAQAHANPSPNQPEVWSVQLSGAPVRLEYDQSLNLPIKAKQTEAPAGPVVLEAPSGSVKIDPQGLLSAELTGGVTLAAAGNRLQSASVSLDRREKGFAIGLGGVTLGLDAASLTGLKPVDLQAVIDKQRK